VIVALLLLLVAFNLASGKRNFELVKFEGGTDECVKNKKFSKYSDCDL
jgi:hypothetical protein